MHDVAVLLLLAFTAIATVDGFYFHIYRYRLYARPECAFEHDLHMVNSVLFPFTLAPLFLAQATGAWLWLAAVATGVTLAIEAWDVLTEGDSRARLGGLTPAEYLMHFLMSGLRWGSMTLVFASIPAGAWSAPASWTWSSPLAGALSFAAWCVGVVAIPAAVIHVLLSWRGAGRRFAETLLRIPALSTP